MKKFLSLVLVLVMTLTLSVNVFAEAGSATVGVAENNVPDNNTQIPVKVKVEETFATPTYKIDLAWDSMVFIYEVSNSYDVSSHENLRTGRWKNDDTDADITVTNHSNDSVTVNATIEEVTNTTGITATFNGGDTTATATLSSAVGSGNTPPSTKFTVYINGAEPAVSAETTISKVTVVIS